MFDIKLATFFNENFHLMTQYRTPKDRFRHLTKWDNLDLVRVDIHSDILIKLFDDEKLKNCQ